MHLCQHCDHFVEENIGIEPGQAPFMHLDNGGQEYDHDATPGEHHRMKEWRELRPDLFIEHADGEIGPNSKFHGQRGKIQHDLTVVP